VLAIRCQFLNGTYQAATPGNVGEPEWPPHPARLHAALVAAGWATGGGDAFPDEARAALEWLERLPAPALSYPPCVGRRTSPDVYVPRNLTPAETRDVLGTLRAGRDPSRQSGRTSRSFPTSVPGDQPVWFIWGDGEGPHDAALTRLACGVQYLGSSRSPVCCDVADTPPAATLVPGGGSGGIALRVAHSGFTDGLTGNRSIHPAPAIGVFAPYRPAETAATPHGPVELGPFGELAIRAFDPTFPYTILHAPLIARAFREAVLAHAGDDAPPILHGHDCNPHVAFLPLANVGHANASGQIVGIAAAIPRSVNDDDRASVLDAVGSVTRLHNLSLPGSWRMTPASERTLFALAPARWLGPARRWQTVTPVVLDRHPKRRGSDALERALSDTFTNAGAPSPERVDWSPIPWQPAAVPAPAYTGQGLPRGIRLHIDVTFKEPVRGPLLIGRARYFGVGLFAPVAARDATEVGDA
jgi:CRISPR-associated protein Csb2